MNERSGPQPTKDTPIRGAAPAAAPTGETRPGGAPFTIESDVHLLDRLAVLYRYRTIATTVFVLTTAAMMIQGYTSIQIFKAQARLQIDDERSTAMPGVNNAENTVLRGSGAVLQHAVQDSSRAAI